MGNAHGLLNKPKLGIDVLIFSATKPVLFVGNQVLRQSKQAYLIGTMGVGRGRVAEALNSTPILNSLPVGLSASGIRKQMVFSPTTNAREVVVSFSESSKSLSSKRYAQGNKALCNLRAWNLFKPRRQSGARDLSIAEHNKIDALAEKVYDSIRKSQIDTDLIAKKYSNSCIQGSANKRSCL